MTDLRFNATYAQLPEKRTNNTLTGPFWILHNDGLLKWALGSLAFVWIPVILFPLLIAILVKVKMHKQRSGALIFHLVLMEMSLAIVHVPLSMLQFFLGQYSFFTDFDCVLSKSVFQLTLQACHWSQFFLSINRFLAATNRMLYERSTTKRALVGTILLSWLISLANNLPSSLGVLGNYIIGAAWNGCTFKTRKEWTTFYAAVTVPVGIYIPLLLSIGIYTVLYLQLLCQRCSRIAASGGHFDTVNDALAVSRNRRIRTGRILFAGALWYCICYSTLIATAIIMPLPGPGMPASYTREMVILWVLALFLSGYIMTPVLFLAVNREYRKKAAEIISCAG